MIKKGFVRISVDAVLVGTFCLFLSFKISSEISHQLQKYVNKLQMCPQLQRQDQDFNKPHFSLTESIFSLWAKCCKIKIVSDMGKKDLRKKTRLNVSQVKAGRELSDRAKAHLSSQGSVNSSTWLQQFKYHQGCSVKPGLRLIEINC